MSMIPQFESKAMLSVAWFCAIMSVISGEAGAPVAVAASLMGTIYMIKRMY